MRKALFQHKNSLTRKFKKEASFRSNVDVDNIKISSQIFILENPNPF